MKYIDDYPNLVPEEEKGYADTAARQANLLPRLMNETFYQ